MAKQMTAVLERAIHTVSAGAPESPLSDRELLLRFVEGNDQPAFAVLVQRYSGMVLGVCRRILVNVQDAEDACQATFLLLARKAATGRWRQSLANWLYTTARQIAFNARLAAQRRARHESRVAPPQTVSPVEQMTGRELLAALEEELDRLHARYREPLVLCYLEGLTRDEAAVRLGIPPATVKTRLERGRARLHDALTRRGCTLGAGLLALTVVSPTKAAGPGLFTSILATVADSPARPVAELAREVIVKSFMHRLFRVTAAAVVIACLGIGLWAGWPAAGGQLPDKESPAKAETPSVKPKPPEDKEGRTISGRVVDSAGKPVAKATIALTGLEYPPPGLGKEFVKELATTDASGSFRCVLPPARRKFPRDRHILVARAPGYASEWIEAAEIDSAEPLVLRLGTAKLPIRGRVLTLEGKPVANAIVQIRSLSALNKKDGLKELYQYWNSMMGRWDGMGAKRLSYPAAADLPRKLTADSQGRFEITGVGDGRVLMLEISADTIDTVQVGVVLDPAFDVKAVHVNPPGMNPNTGKPLTNTPVYGPTFDHVARPCRVIQGRVFDQKTKKPLPDIAVFGFMTVGRTAHTQTDSEGRFRITGLPNAECQLVFNHFRQEKVYPYVSLIKTVGPTPGLAPATVDMPLVQGTVVTGRVSDATTGKPINCRILYCPLSGNKQVLDLPGKDIHLSRDFPPQYIVDADGRFRFVAPPGLGLLTVAASTRALFGEEKPYPQVRLHAADRNKPYFRSDPQSGDRFLNSDGVLRPFEDCYAYRVIEPAVGAESLRVDIQIDRGKSVAGKVIGPDGQPLSGATILGLSAFKGRSTLTGAAFTVDEVHPDDSRTVVALHAEKKLAGTLVVRGNEKAPLVLRLSAWGVVTGRMVDKDGAPIAGATVRLMYRTSPARNPHNQLYMQMYMEQNRGKSTATDAAGRFRIDVPFTGIDFTLSMVHRRVPGLFRLPGLSVKAGETKDLGDVVAKGESAR